MNSSRALTGVSGAAGKRRCRSPAPLNPSVGRHRRLLASSTKCIGEKMFEELTMSQLRSQIEQHLLMVEEVLGGMDTFIQRLEKRVSRIEEGLGLEPEGISASGWVADLQRAKTELTAIRNLVK